MSDHDEQPDRTVILYGIEAKVPESVLVTWDEMFGVWQYGYVHGHLTKFIPLSTVAGEIYFFACAAEHEWQCTDQQCITQPAYWHEIAEAAKKEMEKP